MNKGLQFCCWKCLLCMFCICKSIKATFTASSEALAAQWGEGGKEGMGWHCLPTDVGLRGLPVLPRSQQC